MNCFHRRFVRVSVGLLAVLLFVTPSALAGGRDPFDKRMHAVLDTYLTIQEALAADSTDGIQLAATSIAKNAASLEAETVTGEHSAHYKDLPTNLQTSAEALSKSTSLEAARDAFKRLSKPMAMWGTMSEPDGIDVLFCSMANGSWLQKHGEVRNPYYGKSMLTCGEVVGGVGHSKTSKTSMKHGHHGGMEGPVTDDAEGD